VLDAWTLDRDRCARPQVPNDSPENQAKNRRVELAIYANDDMKQAAQDGTL